jgi:hypothetical protein
MQDIPRNELLDKIDAGWTVRRKGWGMMACSSKRGGNTIIGWLELLENDWQGEPPGPSIRYKNCSIEFAFSELKRSDTKYIRRPNWDEKGKCTFDHKSSQLTHVYELRLEDILTGDWEVWA